MGLRMKTLIFCALLMFRRGSSQNTNIQGGLPKKGGGLGQFADLRGFGKKEGLVFLSGELIPWCTL